jgi:alanyl-tRNA synthetase
MWSVDQIRSRFIDFFVKNGHKHVQSSPLIPSNDPSLLFTAAGMVPFKGAFTGDETPPAPAIVTSQKCLRAGGKHNDLDQVGYTSRHHTFFEMLGNFSFGDYFKEKAITLAWNFITKELGIDQDRLYVTVYHTDDEAFGLWKTIAGLPDDRIIKIATNDNFWAMGDTGPCGPCSEIFYDHGPHIEGGLPGTPEEDGDRFVEIWNLVFMQYDRDADGNLNPLPNPCIDTGMGLERIAAVMQNSHDNYHIDLFKTLIERAASAVNTPISGPKEQSLRVVADHLRAVSFMISDGILPSNEGRGYVLRRIMRRAIRHIYKMGCDQPVLFQLSDTLIREMGKAYPELFRAQDAIKTTIQQEEIAFLRTIKSGLSLLENAMSQLMPGQRLPGNIAFKLYDTYGFPLDLTEDIMKSEDKFIDIDGFNTAMAQQKEKARAAWKGSGDQKDDSIWKNLADLDIPATDFIGYGDVIPPSMATILAIIKDNQVITDPTVMLGKNENITIITNQTPFYAESGGQAADIGWLYGHHKEAPHADEITPSSTKLAVNITNVQKKAGRYFAHIGIINSGQIHVGMNITLKIDQNLRNQSRAHHSATHLLHAALRHVLGPHVMQKGSLVTPDRLRFDFSHAFPIEQKSLDQIEMMVNHYIRQNGRVTTRQMTPKAAMDEGAMALFGEKYGEEVRVVSMGVLQESSPINNEKSNDRTGFSGNQTTSGQAETAAQTVQSPQSTDEKPYSIELCGGTHVNYTGDIGHFVITSEMSVSSGIRRIEAVCGAAADQWLQEQRRILRQSALLLKSSPKQLPEACEKLLEERQKLKSDLKTLKQQQLRGMHNQSSHKGAGAGAEAGGAGSLTTGVMSSQDIHGITLITQTTKDIAVPDMKQLIDHYRQKHEDAIVCVIGENDGKIAVIIGITKNRAQKNPDDGSRCFDAGQLIKSAVEILGGKGGGGRPDFAQGGGKSMEKAADVFAMLESALKATIEA